MGSTMVLYLKQTIKCYQNHVIVTLLNDVGNEIINNILRKTTVLRYQRVYTAMYDPLFEWIYINNVYFYNHT